MPAGFSSSAIGLVVVVVEVVVGGGAWLVGVSYNAPSEEVSEKKRETNVSKFTMVITPVFRVNLKSTLCLNANMIYSKARN